MAIAKNLVLMSAVALAVSLAIFSGCAKESEAQFVYQGESMQPTYHEGERLMLRKSEAIDRGDVIVAKLPHSQHVVLRRVIAVGGDTVRLEDGELSVNGEPMSASPSGQSYALVNNRYITSVNAPLREPALLEGVVHVPSGYVFVVGDNPPMSLDSRHVGPVPRSAILGVVEDG